MKIDVLIERTLFASRWLLAPIYLSLSGLLLIFTIRIVRELVQLAVEVPTIGEVEVILGALSLIDLALVAIPAGGVLAALEACAAAGVGHCVVISSGFAEEGAARASFWTRAKENFPRSPPSSLLLRAWILRRIPSCPFCRL